MSSGILARCSFVVRGTSHGAARGRGGVDGHAEVVGFWLCRMSSSVFAKPERGGVHAIARADGILMKAKWAR